jgi:hypothetical protein
MAEDDRTAWFVEVSVDGINWARPANEPRYSYREARAVAARPPARGNVLYTRVRKDTRGAPLTDQPASEASEESEEPDAG